MIILQYCITLFGLLMLKTLLGRNLFTSEGNLRGGQGSGLFRITSTRWLREQMCTHRPHPGLTNCEPPVKRLQPTCADRAANPDLPVI